VIKFLLRENVGPASCSVRSTTRALVRSFLFFGQLSQLSIYDGGDLSKGEESGNWVSS